MKYVVIVVVVIILVRIDVILGLFDKTAAKYQNKSVDVNNVEIGPGIDLVPIANDLSFQTSPLKTFLSMLNDFHTNPDVNVKNKVIEILRANPVMFSDKLNVELETAIFRLRDLLIQRDKVTHEFLLEMMKSLRGENLEMMRRFFSFAIDIDLPEFLAAYSKSSDVNCLIMGYLGDNLPDDEKYNELSERLEVLDAFLLTEKALPFKNFGIRCQLILKMQIDKLRIAAGSSEATTGPENETPKTVTPTEPVPIPEPPSVLPVPLPVPTTIAEPPTPVITPVSNP